MFFNTPEESAGEEFELLPNGQYKAAVISTELKNNKAGTGNFMAVALRVVSGPREGRQIFINFTMAHPNETAVKIGRADMKRFLTACGISDALKTVADFHAKVANKLVLVDIEQEVGKDDKTRAVAKRFSPPFDSVAHTGVLPKSSIDADSIPF